MSIRSRLPEWRGWLPAFALALGMFIALLALGGDRGFFYRAEGDDHDWGTVKNLAIAENLSPEHNFLLTLKIWRDEDGGLNYDPYGRFPIGGFVLLKLALLPFGNDFAAKLMAARVLMLMMFCGAAAFGFLAMSRITGSRWVALAAAALAFSGFYAVYYADAVSNESVMDLFGAGLVFHGMAIFVQEGRFRQLLIKTCAALLLGWHVYALLLPFTVLGIGGEAVALSRAGVSANEKFRAARSALNSLVRSRCAVLAAVAILFGSALMAFNLANEYRAVAGEGGGKTLSGLPSVKSALRRFGLSETYYELEWGDLIRRQFYRVGVSSVPYAAARAVGYEFEGFEPTAADLAPVTWWGLAATGAALAALALARRRRLLMSTAILFGFCWAIPMRHNVFEPSHAHEAVHYVWLALALYAAALLGARRLLGERAAIVASALAAPIFALSVFYAGQATEGAHAAERQRGEMADFDAIREMTREKTVAFPPLGWYRYIPIYYMTGIYGRVMGEGPCEPASADFTVSEYRVDIPNLRASDNRFAFLYEDLSPPELCRAKRRQLESSEPAARSFFDVYLRDGAVEYLKAPCEPRDYEAPFYAYAHPSNPDDLPAEFREYGYHPIEGSEVFDSRVAAFDGACLWTFPLPTYPIAAVQTGQWIPGEERLWEVFAAPPLNAEALAYYERTYQDVASSGDPAARSGGFDLYLNGDTLSYLKDPCGEDDTRGRFFLSVHPADVADLPAARREHGHESLNFTFAPPAGVVFNGKCMVTRRLPDYPIARIETGQWVPGGERVWDAEIAVGD